MSKKKLELPTFEVTLWDKNGEEAETLIVRAVPFTKIDDVKELQISLIKAFEEKKGSLSELIGDKGVYQTMVKLAGLLRVVGQDKPGFDITSLYEQGDIIQLGKIFFTESVEPSMRSAGYTDVGVSDGQVYKVYNRPEHRQNPTPSAIARIHDLPFFDLLIGIRAENEKKEEDEKKETKAVPKLNPVETAA